MASITIGSVALSDWQGGSTIALRIKVLSSFTSAQSTIWLKTLDSKAGLGDFYVQSACTVAGNTLTIPAITLDSTTDSPDNPSAQYKAVFIDTSTGDTICDFGPAFALGTSAESITWAAIFTAAGQAAQGNQ